ncbi:MAG: endonuclease/exonuclease/phosphatase family protein, partial [Candidatus Hodarchaeota archaeon]
HYISSSLDISAYGWTQFVGWVLAIVATFMMIGLLMKTSDTNSPKDGQINSESSSLTNSGSSNHSVNTWKNVGLSFGITSILIIIYFVFSSPTVISRWTEGDYLLITTILALVITVFIIMISIFPHFISRLDLRLLWVWNGLFVALLIGTILLNQIPFLFTPPIYPLFAPPTTFLHHLLLILVLILSPVILVDFTLLSRVLIESKPTTTSLGGSFVLSSLFFLLMIFANIFTTTYDYIPIVGPLFRDMIWFVYLIVVLAVALPIFLIKKTSLNFQKPIINLQTKVIVIILVAILLGTFGGVLVTSPLPTEPGSVTSIKVLTYNILQGNNEYGIKNFDGQLELLRNIDADIIGLQESDPARIAGGNSDVVRFFANNLHLYSYYGPKTVTGTFGIALLSKYPILNVTTFYMYSEGEQTAAIEAQITIDSKMFNVFVTHLGNGGPLVQQETFLQEINGKSNVIAMGDFNFRPYTTQYNLTTGVLDDSWLLKWSTGDDGSGINSNERIDHIFVSSGTIILDSRFILSVNSDHPALWTEIQI